MSCTLNELLHVQICHWNYGKTYKIDAYSIKTPNRNSRKMAKISWYFIPQIKIVVLQDRHKILFGNLASRILNIRWFDGAITLWSQWRQMTSNILVKTSSCNDLDCSALFLQRALHTVHCTNIMHSRKPSFVINPPFLVNTVNCYSLHTRQ